MTDHVYMVPIPKQPTTPIFMLVLEPDARVLGVVASAWHGCFCFVVQAECGAPKTSHRRFYFAFDQTLVVNGARYLGTMAEAEVDRDVMSDGLVRDRRRDLHVFEEPRK